MFPIWFFKNLTTIAITPEFGTWQGAAIVTASKQCCTRSMFLHRTGEEKEVKGIYGLEKKKQKTSLFAYDTNV